MNGGLVQTIQKNHRLHSCIKQIQIKATAFTFCVSCGTDSIYQFRQHERSTCNGGEKKKGNDWNTMHYQLHINSVLITDPQLPLKWFHQILQFKPRLVAMHMQLMESQTLCESRPAVLLSLPLSLLSLCLKCCLFLQPQLISSFQCFIHVCVYFTDLLTGSTRQECWRAFCQVFCLTSAVNLGAPVLSEKEES